MHYTVEGLAEASGIKVGRICSYRGKGLIPDPERQGLSAIYNVPDDLVAAAEAAGVLEPSQRDGEDFFTSRDLERLESGPAVLGDLFDDHVCKVTTDGDDPEVAAEAFPDLSPRLPLLVALHVQRTLVNRAMERLRTTDEGPSLARALAAFEAAQIEGECRK